jgi:hypothetical protein
MHALWRVSRSLCPDNLDVLGMIHLLFYLYLLHMSIALGLLY